MLYPSRVDWRLLNFWFLYSFLLPKSWEALTKLLSRCENWQRKKEKAVCFTYFAKMLLVFSPPFSLALRMDLLLNTNPFTVVCCLVDAFAWSCPLWWLGGLMACEPSKSWKLSQLHSWFVAWSDLESPLSGRVVNIAATALVTDAATALFGEAGVTAATGVMTVGDTLITCRVTEVVHVAVWCYDDTTDWLVFLLYGWLVMILCQVFYLHSRQ